MDTSITLYYLMLPEYTFLSVTLTIRDNIVTLTSWLTLPTYLYLNIAYHKKGDIFCAAIVTIVAIIFSGRNLYSTNVMSQM
jgi:hypothetical protein